jgi:predicted PurR-regulated permease PerM
MMEIVLFTVVAAALYLLTEQVLRAVERYRGEPLANRTLVFFVVILALALLSFELINRLLPGPSVG